MPRGRKDADSVKTRRIILSCEHAHNRVPPRYKHLFANKPAILKTHRGFDIGIATIAVQLQKQLSCPLHLYPWTRLLIDVNRTNRRSLFSQFGQKLSDTDKQHLIEAYYTPYKENLDQDIAKQLQQNSVLHLSLHSFTPILNGKHRNADIGILYDPSRTKETDYAKALQTRLQQAIGLRIRRNYPYLGRSDGIATWLRKRYPETHYLGIEIELNQAFLASLSPKKRADFVKLLTKAI